MNECSLVAAIAVLASAFVKHWILVIKFQRHMPKSATITAVIAKLATRSLRVQAAGNQMGNSHTVFATAVAERTPMPASTLLLFAGIGILG